MKWLAAALLLIIVGLQFRLWVSQDGVREIGRLEKAVEQQRAENTRMVERNRQLVAEVRDLKSGMVALEERARSELGMIARGESFYQVVPPKPQQGTRSPTRTAAR